MRQVLPERPAAPDIAWRQPREESARTRHLVPVRRTNNLGQILCGGNRNTVKETLEGFLGREVSAEEHHAYDEFDFKLTDQIDLVIGHYRNANICRAELFCPLRCGRPVHSLSGLSTHLHRRHRIPEEEEEERRGLIQ
jgi:hypothetical protein